MNPYFEDALKYNHVSVWRSTLEKMRLAFATAATEAHAKERMEEADLSEKPDEMDWKSEETAGFCPGL